MTSIERTIIEVLVLIALICGAILYLEHRGAVKIEAADKKAQIAAQKQADAQTALNLAKASKADEVASASQKAVDDYRAAHPEQPIRLCHTNSSLASVPKTASTDGSAKSAGTRSATVPEVSGRSESVAGPDIAADLDSIVQAAQRLAIIDSDRQKRQ